MNKMKVAAFARKFPIAHLAPMVDSEEKIQYASGRDTDIFFLYRGLEKALITIRLRGDSPLWKEKPIFGKLEQDCAVCYELVRYPDHGGDITAALLLTITGSDRNVDSLVKKMKVPDSSEYTDEIGMELVPVPLLSKSTSEPGFSLFLGYYDLFSGLNKNTFKLSR